MVHLMMNLVLLMVEVVLIDLYSDVYDVNANDVDLHVRVHADV